VRNRKRTFIGLAATAVAATLLLAGSATATLTAQVGSTTERQWFKTENLAWNSPAAARTAWVNVPGANQSLTLPNRHMLEVDFGAESRCTGPAGTWCSVRVVLVRPPSPLQELHPVAGTNFAFDSGPTADGYEAHAIKRITPFLDEGPYRILVQARMVGATRIRLDEWTLSIKAIAP
jgi:hypothetical protein